ncbi:MAG TPA: glycosyltransferase family 39 protein [Spirochaetota bacterium]|mgnify:CR=1 FL=1|nr:glycosyltransferase family 39 protein [Spirochaetota bacterium]HPI88963.1 glycosyltransferase family 39 protein [Spirochaetota bacterium]HPR47450.1 glycosyltransferase family 39 protein [Spirochaetota bacterium]
MNNNFILSLFASRKSAVPLLILSILVLTAVYFPMGLYNLGQHLYIGETDTFPFIKYTLDLQATGSVAGFFASMFNGTFLPSNQHPLFPLLMSFFEPDGMNFFVNVKLLNFMLGYIFILLFFGVMYRETNPVAAFLGALLFIANDSFMLQATMVCCEPLLLVFVLFSFYFLIKGIDNNGYWVPAGLFTGLAYMTKASGLFIVFGFGLFLLFDVRLKFWKLLRNRYLWLFLGMFLLVSTPLLVRNTIAYGFPFHNFNVDRLAMDADWGRVTYKRTFSDIFRQDISYIITRFFHGLAIEFRVMLHSLYSFSIHLVPKFSADLSSLAEKIIAAVLSVVMLLLSAAGFARSSLQKNKKILIVFLITGFYLPLSWYSITSPNRRYLLPLLPFFVFFSSLFLVSAANRIAERFFAAPEQGEGGKSRILFVALMVCALACTAVFSLRHEIPAPRETYRFEDGYHEIADYLRKNLGKDKTCINKGFHHYNWTLFYPDLIERMAMVRVFRSLSEFNEYVEKNSTVCCMIMQPEMYRATKNIFSEFVGFDRLKGIVVKKPIPGWEIVMQDAVLPVDYVLYRKISR